VSLSPLVPRFANAQRVAMTFNIDQVAAFCGGVPTPCPACVGGVAEGFVSECREGRCVVEQLLK